MAGYMLDIDVRVPNVEIDVWVRNVNRPVSVQREPDNAEKKHGEGQSEGDQEYQQEHRRRVEQAHLPRAMARNELRRRLWRGPHRGRMIPVVGSSVNVMRTPL